MDMCYDGALVLPSSYAVMNENEMSYTEGGAVSTLYKTAKSASSYLQGKAAYYAACGTVASGGAAATSATVLAALGFGSYAAMSFKMAHNYESAYNSAQSILANKGNVRCKIQETTMFAVYVSNVTCKRA